MVKASEADWARYGVEPGWSFAIAHRVRWSECDPFRHANHRAYFEWFEEARNRYLEAVGLAPLSPNSPGPVIAETSIRYHPAARLCRRNPGQRPHGSPRAYQLRDGVRGMARRALRPGASGADPGGQRERREDPVAARTARTHSRPRSVRS